jgi:hypothetical protein
LIAPKSQANTYGPEQLVMASQYSGGQTNFWVGDFYVNRYAFTQIGFTDLGDEGCTLGMQVGNFDQQTPSGTYDPGEQVAFLFNKPGCTSGSPSLFTYSLTVPQNLTPTFQTTNWLNNSKSNITVSASGNQNAYTYPVSMSLDVADVQGRSQLLGAPIIVTVPKQTQPDVVLGMPPMHVDYVLPPNPAEVCQPNTGDGITTPCVANIDYEPTPPNTTSTPFTTAFNLSSTTSQKTYSNSKSSWGLSVKTSEGLKVKFNDLEENASLNIKDTASALYNSTVATTTSNLNTASNSVKINTSTDDELFFTERDMTIYYYPVLGVADSNSNNAPVYVEFSVPSNVQTNLAEGAKQDWYQPVQEPGNVLSYPWNLAQLQNGFSNTILPVSQTQGVVFQVPNSGDTTFTATWASSSGNSQSLGTVNTFSNDLSVSGSEGAGVSGVDSADISFGLDVNSSNSLSTLNVETATVDQSTGVTLTIPGIDSFNGDAYCLANFIFGESNPSGTQVLQVLTPTINENNQSTATQQTTQGPLFVNYVADAVPQVGTSVCASSNGQTQWQSMYNVPDVGFNHPQRWHWQANATRTVPAGVSFNHSDSSNPIRSHFYHMKGFFITSASGSSSGPSLTSATAGDQLELHARVYNFSLVDTDPNGTVVVDFYAQSYCAGNVCGTPYEIGQARVSQSVPGYKSLNFETGNQPNWITASVPFDTSKVPTGPLVFWAVTWIEGQNGSLDQEMTGHGLSAFPAENLSSIAAVPLEAYSNNVGLYGAHTQFHLFPASAPGAARSAVLLTAKDALPNVTVSVPRRAVLESDVDVLATLQSSTALSVDSMSLSYFDGDPRKGGTLVDHQVIHHIDPNGMYIHRASFQALSCGPHEIFAELFTQGNVGVISQGEPLHVYLDPLDAIQGMSATLASLDLPKELKKVLTLVIDFAKCSFEREEKSRGEAALRIFSEIVDCFYSTCHPSTARKLQRLGSEALTIRQCNPHWKLEVKR